MRISVNVPLIVVALVFAACGGSSSATKADASTGPTDVSPALADASSAADDSGAGTETCNVPRCIAALGSACVPDGSCVSQISLSPPSATICYANGLRYQEAVAGTGTTATIKASNGPTPCFTGTAAASSLVGTVTFTLIDIAGVEIATMSQNTTTGATTVTCKDGQPVLLNAACSGGGGCTIGTCP